MTDPANAPRIRLVIADDHAIFRDGLRRLIAVEPDLELIGEAASARETITITRNLKPDILLLDVAMPDASGLEALRGLSTSLATTKVILLTAAIDRADIVKALQLGAHGLVLKESATVLLMEAIRRVAAGEHWVGRETVSDLVSAIRSLTPALTSVEAKPNYGLTQRELEITALIMAAAGNKEIAQQLGISEKTVKHHITNIFDKVGVSSRLELALFAVHNLKFPERLDWDRLR